MCTGRQNHWIHGTGWHVCKKCEWIAIMRARCSFRSVVSRQRNMKDALYCEFVKKKAIQNRLRKAVGNLSLKQYSSVFWV